MEIASVRLSNSSDYLVEHPPEIGLDTLLGRSIRERKILHTPDALAGESYRAGVPLD